MISPDLQIFWIAQCVLYMPTLCVGESDTSSIDHLIMREFVGGAPRYHSSIRGVGEQFVGLETSEHGVFVQLRVFVIENDNVVFSVCFLDHHLMHSLRGSARLVSGLLFVEIKAHMHMLCVYGPTC